ncbi:oligosaccharide flippase family protein [Flavobacterium glaciei]|uniref:O-antigen/teichoic acid export membrane protein n=1 Tax=Flavobacterium glaciei TaxID=386300 RepID=A0A562PKT2_9FLAO|nr:oligosaccharide flippase family protein [Flavobacterium glaciei]RDI50363.1 O-antigen/teichoic acid export membrane protein [Flavobacterium glaciei]TWI44646.1 O-antigen/teichoic acid export membrane protein [Flavobacterium glaciei]
MKIASYTIPSIPTKLSPEQLFMVTILLVNGGNYLYNLLLGRILGPAAFSDAAILITFLLILSFVGMTFQIVSAKYAVLFSEEKLVLFTNMITKYALLSGIAIGMAIVLFYQEFQELFHTKTASMFMIFGIGIPFYFMMSINRGLYQGKNLMKKLALTYQTEMASRLVLTISAVLLLPAVPPSIIVAFGILLSFVFGLFPFQKNIGLSLKFTNVQEGQDTLLDKKAIITFFLLTAFYEFTQIIINNSDIILVKHYFDSEQAGLYASLALIGRVVYFVAWMFVMLLLPKVIQLKKDGQETKPILMKYVAYITVLSSFIVLVTFVFPETVVHLMFGKAYLSIAYLLWKYALATSVFAIANIFAYYFLSINQYIPVVVSGLIGLTQIVLIVLFHDSLQRVVEMQIIAMVALLFFQLTFFFYHNKKHVRLT